jgi:hypothetical protein
VFAPASSRIVVAYSPYTILYSFIENTLTLMDADSNGVITLEELTANVLANPDTFLMLLGV